MNYKQFINEKLGIVEELPAIADTILDRFKTEKEFIMDVTIAGRTTKLKCIFDDSEKAKKISTAHLNPDVKMSTLSTTVLDKGTIIHELKHLHRSVLRKFKRTKHDFVSGVNGFISKKHSHVFDDDSNLFYYIIYYSNPNEFEAHYNQFYHNLKTEFESKEYTDEEKRKYIDEYLGSKLIYMTHSIITKTIDQVDKKFTMRSVFKTKTIANEYLGKLAGITKELIKTQNDENHSSDVLSLQLAKEISGYSKLLSKAKLVFSKYIKDGELDEKLVDYVNDIVNKTAKKNMKKFHRLYTLLIDGEKTEDL